MDGYDFIKILIIIIILTIPITIIYNYYTDKEERVCEEFEVVKFNQNTMTQTIKCESGEIKEIPIFIPSVETKR